MPFTTHTFCLSRYIPTKVNWLLARLICHGEVHLMSVSSKNVSSALTWSMGSNWKEEEIYKNDQEKWVTWCRRFSILRFCTAFWQSKNATFFMQTPYYLELDISSYRELWAIYQCWKQHKIKEFELFFANISKQYKHLTDSPWKMSHLIETVSLFDRTVLLCPIMLPKMVILCGFIFGEFSKSNRKKKRYVETVDTITKLISGADSKLIWQKGRILSCVVSGGCWKERKTALKRHIWHKVDAGKKRRWSGFFRFFLGIGPSSHKLCLKCFSCTCKAVE